MSVDLTGEPFADDRIMCTSCRELARNGDCLAAREGRRRDVGPYYGPAYPADLPRRCEHFLPLLDAADQRTGRERFPLLARLYDEAMAERDRERRGSAQRGLARAKAAISNTS